MESEGEKAVFEDGKVVLTLQLKRWEAARLSMVLSSVAERTSATSSQMEAARWRAIARELRIASRSGIPEINARGRARRPPSAYENHFDMDHVLNGNPPFPLLSVRDNRTVWEQLEKRSMTALDIAERLRVHPRTVVRWRANARKGEGT